MCKIHQRMENKKKEKRIFLIKSEFRSSKNKMLSKTEIHKERTEDKEIKNKSFNILFLYFDFRFFSLQYCRTMRDQILESFNHRDFSLMVIGNKFDLVTDTHRHSQVC